MRPVFRQQVYRHEPRFYYFWSLKNLLLMNKTNFFLIRFLKSYLRFKIINFRNLHNLINIISIEIIVEISTCKLDHASLRKWIHLVLWTGRKAFNGNQSVSRIIIWSKDVCVIWLRRVYHMHNSKSSFLISMRHKLQNYFISNG